MWTRLRLGGRPLILERLIVISDFDGTLTPIDVGEAIITHFIGTQAKPWNEKLARQEIGSQTFYTTVYQLFDASPRELAKFLDGYRLHEDFPTLVDFLQEHGIPFVITSDGFDFYIQHLLSRANIQVPVYCNRLTFPNQRAQVAFPAANPQCAHCGTCKAGIVRSFQKQGKRVIYLGDGNSDMYPAAYADLVFARHRLAHWCKHYQIPYEPFNSCLDVVQALEKRWLTHRPLPGPQHTTPRQRILPSDRCQWPADLSFQRVL